MPNSATFSASTPGSKVVGTVTDKLPAIPGTPPTGLTAIGPRITPNFINVPWSADNTYQYYDVVQVAGTSYIARKAVPADIQIDNTEYWIKWADPNAQMAELQNTVNTFENKITQNTNNISDIYAYIEKNFIIYSKVSTESDDNTETLQNEIDYLNTNGGGIIYIKAGTYNFNDTIILKSNVTIKGSGENNTILNYNNSTSKTNKFIQAGTDNNYVQNIGITDLTLNGNELNPNIFIIDSGNYGDGKAISGKNGYGIYLCAYIFNIKNLNIINFNAGIYTVPYNGNINANQINTKGESKTIHNVNVYFCERGIYNSANDMNYNDIVIGYCYSPFYFSDCNITNLHSWGCYTNGTLINARICNLTVENNIKIKNESGLNITSAQHMLTLVNTMINNLWMFGFRRFDTTYASAPIMIDQDYSMTLICNFMVGNTAGEDAAPTSISPLIFNNTEHAGISIKNGTAYNTFTSGNPLIGGASPHNANIDFIMPFGFTANNLVKVQSTGAAFTTNYNTVDTYPD